MTGTRALGASILTDRRLDAPQACTLYDAGQPSGLDDILRRIRQYSLAYPQLRRNRKSWGQSKRSYPIASRLVTYGIVLERIPWTFEGVTERSDAPDHKGNGSVAKFPRLVVPAGLC